MKKDAIILIAENDESQYKLITRNLRRSGLDNDFVKLSVDKDLFDYYDRLKEDGGLQKHPHLLILDTNMPQIDKLQLLQMVKSDHKLRKMPVIVFSENVDEPVLQEFQRTGCSMFLVKPADAEEFSDMVQKIGSFISIIEIPSFSEN